MNSVGKEIKGEMNIAAQYVHALKYPILGWITLDTSLVVLLRIFPHLPPFPFTGGFAVVIGFAIGALAGYKIVDRKGSFLDAVIAGVIVGLFSAFLQIAYVGSLIAPSEFDFEDKIAWGVHYFQWNLIGTVIAGGFAATK